MRRCFTKSDTTGFREWPASDALAKYLTGLELSDQVVLEIGCGCSRKIHDAIQAAGGKPICTDSNPEVKPDVVLDFRRLPHVVFAVIVGCDVSYNDDFPLLGLLVHLAPGGVLYLADPGRASTIRLLENLPAGVSVTLHPKGGMMIYEIRPNEN